VIFCVVLEANGQRLVVSDRHTAIICNDGNVYAWGGNSNGQLGDGTTSHRNYPVRALGLPRVAQLAVTDYATFAVTDDGLVYFWGTASDNQLGIPSWPQFQHRPIQLPTVSNVKQVAPGESHVAYLLRDGNVVVSGQNAFGVYGNSSEVTIDTGVVYCDVASVVQIASARASCLAILQGGAAMGWGWNANNLIDSSASLSILKPEPILDVSDVVQLNVSFSSENAGAARALSAHGELIVWGKNYKGQLGVSNTPVVKIPTTIPLPESCVAVASGSSHTLALMNDGTVWAWGDNNLGQLGKSGMVNSEVPTRVLGLSSVTEIAAGGYSSFAITRDGKLFGWGSNVFNQINADTADLFQSPVEVQLPCTITTVAITEPKPHTDALFPNPASEYISLDLSALCWSQPIEMIVYARNGLEVHRVKHTGTTLCRTDVGSLPDGLYHVVVAAKGVTKNYTFVKY